MPLYQSVTLKLRKALAVFVCLAQPHADHSFAVGSHETVNYFGVMLEVMLQDGPLNGKRSVHDGVPTPASGPVFDTEWCDQVPDHIGINIEYEVRATMRPWLGDASGYGNEQFVDAKPRS